MRWFGLVLLLAMPLTAMAGPPDGPPHGGHRGPPPLAHVVSHHADEIGIDDETLARVEAIDEAARETTRSLHDDLRAAYEALRAAMEADVPEPKAVFAASARIGHAETALREHRLQTDLAVIAELSAEQWATLRAQRPERLRR